MPLSRHDALDQLARLPALQLAHYPTPLEDMHRLAGAIGFRGRLLVKRDDAISFGFGGNKVRKLEVLAADACGRGADTLVTTGGIQSNHARATAATAAKLGLRCVIVANGTPPERPTANALLNRLLGAELHYVATRDERAPAVKAIAQNLVEQGRKPYEIPLGASTPLGAAAFARVIGELIEQSALPDVIVHATSSGGTQAGLVAGCELFGLRTRVIGFSADEPAPAIQQQVREIVRGLGTLLGIDGERFASARAIDVDDGFVGAGYGMPTAESMEAIELAARTEALFLDPTYTAKAMAGLIAWIRGGAFTGRETILFWHTGGHVGLFA